MRPILLGPFGSMGVLNMKLRIICIEDMFLESFILLFAVFRIISADTVYELWGAYASLSASTCIVLTTSFLVLGGGVQCLCCRSKPLCTTILRCVDFISDKTLIKLFSLTSQLGVLVAVFVVITECFTFGDEEEAKRHVVDIPDSIHISYLERDNAIVIIVLQILITIPWRLYTFRIAQGVLGAIHCVEVLQFRSNYSADALRKLLPDTGLVLGVGLAHESDVPELASLYCEGFSSLFTHIGLPEGSGPAVIEALWRSKGDLALARWLGRVGVVRDDRGHILGALSLQLPGDTAAYESLMYRSYSDTYNALNPLDVSTVSTTTGTACGVNDDAFLLHSSLSSTRMHSELSAEYEDEGKPMSMAAACLHIGIINGLRFRYKHAIIVDHVCPPGEAYVDFLTVRKEARRDGVGTRLMKWAEQSAEKLGCGRIALSVWGLDKATQLFYENLGYGLSEDRTDFISRCIIQVIFCFKDRFYDFEKALGQEQGLAIHASRYGFTSDIILERDDSSDGDGSSHGGRIRGLGARSLVNGGVFVLRASSNSRSGYRGNHFQKESDRSDSSIEDGRRHDGGRDGISFVESSSHGLLATHGGGRTDSCASSDTASTDDGQSLIADDRGLYNIPLFRTVMSWLSAVGVTVGLASPAPDWLGSNSVHIVRSAVDDSQSWDYSEKSIGRVAGSESGDSSTPTLTEDYGLAVAQSMVEEHTPTSKAIAESIQKYNLMISGAGMPPVDLSPTCSPHENSFPASNSSLPGSSGPTIAVPCGANRTYTISNSHYFPGESSGVQAPPLAAPTSADGLPTSRLRRSDDAGALRRDVMSSSTNGCIEFDNSAAAGGCSLGNSRQTTNTSASVEEGGSVAGNVEEIETAAAGLEENRATVEEAESGVASVCEDGAVAGAKEDVEEAESGVASVCEDGYASVRVGENGSGAARMVEESGVASVCEDGAVAGAKEDVEEAESGVASVGLGGSGVVSVCEDGAAAGAEVHGPAEATVEDGSGAASGGVAATVVEDRSAAGTMDEDGSAAGVQLLELGGYAKSVTDEAGCSFTKSITPSAAVVFSTAIPEADAVPMTRFLMLSDKADRCDYWSGARDKPEVGERTREDMK